MATRPIRIANCSGAIGDGPDQIYRLAKAGGIDAITGDYLAEFNLAWRAIDQAADASKGFEAGFLGQLAWHDGDAARLVAEKKIKIVNDGGALNPQGLAVATDRYLQSLGITNLTIAWVTGDDLTAAVREGRLLDGGGNDDKNEGLPHLDKPGVYLTDEDIQAMLTANAYTGQAGIVRALQEGADIVICGRCCDASPVMGLATWWHGWGPEAYDALAGSLVAGHLIECGPSVTGGNFCGVYEIARIHDLGYPIVEIAGDGSFVLTKHAGTAGAVTRDTCTAQLLYEIQGPRYLTPDVAVNFDSVTLEDAGPDRVRVFGVTGAPPPPTTKLAVCLRGGYQVEFSVFCAGLNTEDKFRQMKEGVLGCLDRAAFSTICIDRYGTAPADPSSEAACTVAIRFFAQAPTKEALATLRSAIFVNGLQGFCGMHTSMDWRALEPREYVRYVPVLVRQSLVPLQVHMLAAGKDHASTSYTIAARPVDLCSAASAAPQASYDPDPNVSLPLPLPPSTAADGKVQTVRRPLGDLVFARSGDKGSNSSIGFWVRDDAAYAWLRAFLTMARAKALLGRDWSDAYGIERCEFPNLRAVHIVVKGLLQEGVSCSSIIDGFGKSVGEFMRARFVDLPVNLVAAEDARRTAAWAKAGRTYTHL
ncbi:hypothetical protein SPI_07287 [Niveomyces insectorum RCEF 264]|uniref:DUF1446 domain containing protein n=1 Tax=Niveomyces insectorum RCEF 264 TaxID=1081102 RepID=A0A167QGQ3_9HYPO|nr:hypothetical protein SPI_07287 [Niveomyces insectorum RCEF 264]